MMSVRERLYNNACWSALGVAICAIGVSGAAFAQESDVSPADIVVTAKSRAEKLQDVPLAISAFSSDDLNKKQIRDIRDLQQVAPNVSLFSGSGRNDPSAFAIRGLTANTSDERYQGVSFFLDGIALSGQLSSLDMTTIERVEVIKGPQSATYGRATYSGAINFVTREPSGDTVTGSVRARGSFTDGAPEANYNFNASLTTPLVQDKLWLSVAGSVMQNGAVARSVDEKAPIGRERSQNATATLFFKPDDSFSIRLRGLYSHDKDSNPLLTVQHPRDWVVAGTDLVPLPRYGGAFLPGHIPDPSYEDMATKGATGTVRDRYFASLIVSKKFGDYELVYRGGYFYNNDDRSSVSVARSAIPGQDPVFGSLIGTPAITLTSFANALSVSREIFKNTSHQVELLSPGDDAFRWRAGAYYFWESDETLLPLSATAANPRGTARKDAITNIAAFGGFDFDLSESFTISGEGRVAKEKLKYYDCAACINPIASGDSVSSTDFTPRITLTYKPAPNHMLYALYSSGVKSGRYSYVVVDGQPSLFYAEPEKLTNFEIGSKNSFDGGRHILNLSAFYNKVSNQQLVSATNYTLPNGNTYSITAAANAGTSKIWGFEVEAMTSITPELTLRGSAGYAHQEFASTNPVVLQAVSVGGFPYHSGPNPLAVVLDGLTQPNVPRWNGSIGADYEVRDVFSDYSLLMNLTGSYRGKFFADLHNDVVIRSSWTVNGRIAVMNDNLEFALFGRNLLNNRRALGSGLAGSTTNCAFLETNTATYGTGQRCLHAAAQRPREIGVEVAFRF